MFDEFEQLDDGSYSISFQTVTHPSSAMTQPNKVVHINIYIFKFMEKNCDPLNVVYMAMHSNWNRSCETEKDLVFEGLNQYNDDDNDGNGKGSVVDVIFNQIHLAWIRKDSGIRSHWLNWPCESIRVMRMKKGHDPRSDALNMLQLMLRLAQPHLCLSA